CAAWDSSLSIHLF
nr:immunoglobulin light chain junction region [Macaca mulatta]MPO05437.1 immunoglobulin light chain junction region [Macaca mulatta]MPO07937.1 immunoglobulin light chain junction region [Macaca mulatta]MPO08535.1 immunoglobulin light chain junction region [Macaca mulatta]MPO08711.1 immunoglobulin light chain junction region [Macaca mulatta]